MRNKTSYVLCAVLVACNVAYLCLVISQMGIHGRPYSIRVLDIPGLMFALLIFPALNVFVWLNRQRIIWIDYSLVIMPPILWLLLVPGGSFTNFIYINPSVIGTGTCLYLLRFYVKVTAKGREISVLKISVGLWGIITFGLILLSIAIPVLPE